MLPPQYACFWPCQVVFSSFGAFPSNNGGKLTLRCLHELMQNHQMVMFLGKMNGDFTIFLGVKRATELLSAGLGVEGFTIGINHGTIGHQEIDHLHVHVIPRRAGDGGGNVHSIVHESQSEDLEVTYKKILDKGK